MLLATWSGAQLVSCMARLEREWETLDPDESTWRTTWMTVLDRPVPAIAPEVRLDRSLLRAEAELRCVVCHKPFDFAAGQAAMVLKHIAYGYDFMHDGACLATAREWIFVEPGYDRPTFSTDGQRVRVLHIASAEGWSAVFPAPLEQVAAGTPVIFDPLVCWALVEYRDGSRRFEGIVRATDWANEPGGAEFPEARTGHRAGLGYAQKEDMRDPAQLAAWEATIHAHYEVVR
jgi:hypothetical protein